MPAYLFIFIMPDGRHRMPFYYHEARRSSVRRHLYPQITWDLCRYRAPRAPARPDDAAARNCRLTGSSAAETPTTDFRPPPLRSGARPSASIYRAMLCKARADGSRSAWRQRGRRFRRFAADAIIYHAL